MFLCLDHLCIRVLHGHLAEDEEPLSSASLTDRAMAFVAAQDVDVSWDACAGNWAELSMWDNTELYSMYASGPVVATDCRSCYFLALFKYRIPSSDLKSHKHVCLAATG